jgi:superfamily II DNA helicase RecQ
MKPQEAGRAGRDGLPSHCVIFYAKRDNPRILNLIRLGELEQQCCIWVGAQAGSSVSCESLKQAG